MKTKHKLAPSNITIERYARALFLYACSFFMKELDTEGCRREVDGIGFFMNFGPKRISHDRWWAKKTFGSRGLYLHNENCYGCLNKAYNLEGTTATV